MTVNEFVCRRWWDAFSDMWGDLGWYLVRCNHPGMTGPHKITPSVRLVFWPRYMKYV